MTGTGVSAWKLERLLHEAVKVKPGLHWRPHNAGSTRAIGVYQGELHAGRAACRKWNQPERENCVAVG